MIDCRLTFHELLTETPALVDFFAANGLPADAADPRAQRLTMDSALRFKEIDPQRFACEAELFLTEYAARLREQDDPDDCDLLVRIPCVVQLPVEEALNRYLRQNAPAVRHNTELVEFGGEWLSERMQRRCPQVIIGGGIEGMANLPGLAEAYEAPQGAMNPDFAGMEDPRGTFRMLSGIPLVMAVDESRLEGRAAPQSIADLLSGAFESSVVYPDDGHMLDGVLLYYFDLAGGEAAVDAFRRACIRGVHPSQMIKYGGIEERPAVMLMPYIFARIKAKEPGMRVVWPAEGAPLIPILECMRRDASPQARAAAEFLAGAEVGRLFAEQGMFPSSHPAVENRLPGKLWFAGWENVYAADLPARLPRLKKRFLEG